MFFDIPQYFEEALEGKSIPLFGSSPHSLAKDSLGLSFPPLKRIKDVLWTYVLPHPDNSQFRVCSLFNFHLSLRKAFVQLAYNIVPIHVLADEDYLLHTVAILLVPVVGQAGIALHHL